MPKRDINDILAATGDLLHAVQCTLHTPHEVHLSTSIHTASVKSYPMSKSQFIHRYSMDDKQYIELV